ncbi:MAG TPA: secretin N-terminal domain-containing protein, partial [Kofleriaceae bacterium]|nr:secretin N-terminal domain-containing protein [Kofleriaceae bacterium]
MTRSRVLAMAALMAVAAAPHAWAQPDQPTGRRGGGAGTPPTGGNPPAGGGATGAGGGTTGTAAVSGPVYNCAKPPKGVTVSFGKSELELQDLLDWAMTFACKNFVLQAGLGGRTSKVVVMSPKKLSPSEAWDLFLVSLNTMGLGLVDKGTAYTVVESSTLKKESLALKRGGVGDSTQMVRAVIHPQHVTADDLAAALNAMTSKDGLVTTLPKSNLVLVTDYASHIAPMRSLVRDLDKAQSGDGLYIIKLQYADVTEVAQIVNDLFGVKSAG